MEMTITAETRTATRNRLGALRRQGLLPLVAYGPEISALSLQVESKAFEQLFHRAGTGALIDLVLPGEQTPRKALIRAFDRDPSTRQPLHAELFVVNLKEEIVAEVPVRLVGEAPSLRADTGVQIQLLDALRVRSMPANLPTHIDVDISSLTEPGTAVHVRDVTPPAGTTILNEPEAVVIEIGAVRVSAEEAEAATVEAAQVTTAEATGTTPAEEGEG